MKWGYWGNVEGGEFGVRAPKKLLETTPFTLAINVTNAHAYIRTVLEKHEK